MQEKVLEILSQEVTNFQKLSDKLKEVVVDFDARSLKSILKYLREEKITIEFDKKIIYAHPTFVEPMLDYIVQDFENSRGVCNDSTIGGMVICDSSEQAKQMFEIFNAKYKKDNDVTKTDTSYTEHLKEKNKVKSAALILHDVGDKQERKNWIDAFKAGKIDFEEKVEVKEDDFLKKEFSEISLDKLGSYFKIEEIKTNENKEDACSMIRHVPLGSTHLGRIAALNQLSREICSHECSLRDAWVRLEECKSIPKNKNWVEIFFCGVGSAGFCYLFGGTALDSFVAFFKKMLFFYVGR